jgi:ABC-type amino acid transport substrate-binding protein
MIRRNVMNRGMSRRSFLRGAGMAAVGGAAVLAGRGRRVRAHDTASNVPSPVYDRVIANQKIRVGVRDESTKFLDIREDPIDGHVVVKGFEPELARALAVALFGNYGDSNIEWVMLPKGDQRFSSVQYDAATIAPGTECDVVFRSATHTVERETGRNVQYYDIEGNPVGSKKVVTTNYGLSYYLDGGDVLFHTKPVPTGGQTLEEAIKATRVWVEFDTTTHTRLVGLGFTDLQDGGGISGSIAGYNADVAAGKNVGIASDSTIVQFLSESGQAPGSYLRSADFGFFSQESLGPITPPNDPLWTDIVNTVIWTFMGADNEFIDPYKQENNPVASHFVPGFVKRILTPFKGYNDLLWRTTGIDGALGEGVNLAWPLGGVHVNPS